MAGIYIHIPFCRQACSYCDFHFTVNLTQKIHLIEAISKEIALRKDFFAPSTEIQTLYFGGGTPGILSAAELSPIFESLHRNFTIAEHAEITLEANPDDLSRDRLRSFRELGINRLSIGIQSFRDEDLKLLRRVHDAEQAKNCIRLAREEGFDNLTIDLIYGIPGLSAGAWQSNIETALRLELPHISAYALTVEPQTLLAKQVSKSQVVMPQDPLFEKHFFSLIDGLEAKGYQHYEISNFALPGHESRHNSSYWKGMPYLGLGPSAHSFQGTTRSWNLKSNTRYMRRVEEGIIPQEDSETLTLTERCNEAIMTGLRLKRGIILKDFEQEFGFSLQEREALKIRTFINKGWMQSDSGAIFLSREGKMLSDHIIGELFQEQD